MAPLPSWFIWDLGNVVIKLAWSRVVAAICANSEVDRDSLIHLMEGPSGYRAMERGEVTFAAVHALLVERAGYRGDLGALRVIWTDFFDGTVDGIVPLIGRTRAFYRLAFLSNSNEVHEEVIPLQFPEVFKPGDVLILSHREKFSKPERALFERALSILKTSAGDCVFVDDLPENVAAAAALGFHAFRFTDTERLVTELESRGLLPPATQLSS